jgi:transposase
MKEMIVKAALKDPRTFGFMKNNWSLEMLSLYLERETCIRISLEWVRHILNEMGIVTKRPKITARGTKNRYRINRLKNHKKVARMLYKKSSHNNRR